MDQQHHQLPNHIAATFTVDTTVDQFLANVNEIIRANRAPPLPSAADLFEMGMFPNNVTVMNGLVRPSMKSFENSPLLADMNRQILETLLTEEPFLAVVEVQEFSENGLDSFMGMFHRVAREMGPPKMKLVLLISENALLESYPLLLRIQNWRRMIADDLELEYYLVLREDPDERVLYPRFNYFATSMYFFSTRSSYVVQLIGSCSLKSVELREQEEHQVHVYYHAYGEWAGIIRGDYQGWALVKSESDYIAMEE